MNNGEPWVLNSMNELLGQARVMEQEAIAGYKALAERMRQANRPDLTAVFEALIREEEGHLGNVENWIEKSPAVTAAPPPSSPPMFDAEGTALIAPELLDAYRALAVAVRNEERAFVFWTYVSAHAASDEIRSAAERMAREELGHVATLRRARRRAFHDLRDKQEPQSVDLGELELHLAKQLRRLCVQTGSPKREILLQSEKKAALRAEKAKAGIRPESPALPGLPEGTIERPLALAEWLLDVYLDLADTALAEQVRLEARDNAADLVEALHHIRSASETDMARMQDPAPPC